MTAIDRTAEQCIYIDDDSLDGVLLTSAERWFFRNCPELPSRDASLRSAIRLAAAESLARKAGAWTEWLTTKPSRSLLALHVGLCTWVEQVPGGPHPIPSQRVIEAHMTLKHQDAILLHMDSDPDGQNLRAIRATLDSLGPARDFSTETRR